MLSGQNGLTSPMNVKKFFMIDNLLNFRLPSTVKARGSRVAFAFGLRAKSECCQSTLGGRPIRLRTNLIFVNSVRWAVVAFLKTISPGTTSLISVPEFEELPSVRFPPMRAVRSRMPCSPKCPSLPPSAIDGSMPVPLSLTRRVRSCAYLSYTSN